MTFLNRLVLKVMLSEVVKAGFDMTVEQLLDELRPVHEARTLLHVRLRLDPNFWGREGEGRQKIQTIKIVRELSGLGLRESKEFVESLDVGERYLGQYDAAVVAVALSRTGHKGYTFDLSE